MLHPPTVHLVPCPLNTTSCNHATTRELAAVRQLAQGLAAAQQQLTASLSSASQLCELSVAPGSTQQQQQSEGPLPLGLQQLQSQASDLQGRSQALTQALAGAADSVAASRAKLQQLQVMSNPHTSGVQQLQRLLEQQQQELSGHQQQHAELARQVGGRLLGLMRPCHIHKPPQTNACARRPRTPLTPAAPCC
jgi:DNA repair ATPase RecN